MGSFKNNLPKTWAYTSLGEAYNVIGGGTPSTEKPEFWGGDTPWITSADIEGVRQINVRKHVTDNGIAGSTTSKVPPRSLLVVTRVGLGKIAIADAPICFSQDLQGLVQKPELIWPEYTLYLLSYELQILKFEGRGTTISGVTKKQLKDLGFPLPPINEQKRIVAKIEELFSELDKGIESFKTAREQLKVYRQALLKHAFEGKLTATWREENKEKLESADALLKRIQSERAERYRQQLKAWEKAVKEWEKGGKQVSKPGKPSQPKQLPPLTAVELAELPELPTRWAYMRLGGLIDDPTYGTSKKCDYQTDGIGVLRIPNVVLGKIDAADLKFAQFSEDEIESYKLCVGDILVIRSNGSISIVGKGAIISESDINYLFAGYLIRLRPYQKLVNPAYLHNVLSLHSVRKQIEQKAKSTSGVNNINSGEIQSLVVAICNIEEQQQIVKELDSRLSEIDNLDKTITTALQQAETLRQSILKKTFSGQLVVQDPNDEPATQLLARIKAEKAAQVKPAKQKAKPSKPRTKKD